MHAQSVAKAVKKKIVLMKLRGNGKIHRWIFSKGQLSFVLLEAKFSFWKLLELESYCQCSFSRPELDGKKIIFLICYVHTIEMLSTLSDQN